jgi:5,10-methylenetetrahydromethanopterin reductase
MGFHDDRPVTALREAVAIIRAMLSGDSAELSGRVFSVGDPRLGFRPRRPDLPIYMAAAGERALKACGEIADGLVISNLTPPRSTKRLVSIVSEAAERAGRPRPRIVQYMPCAVRPDGDAARAVVKVTIGEMLAGLWPRGDDWLPAREALVKESGIPRRDFVAALARLRYGENAGAVIDDRFVAAFAIAGTAEECRQQAMRYGAAGVDELALTFAGAQPLDDLAYFHSRCEI